MADGLASALIESNHRSENDRSEGARLRWTEGDALAPDTFAGILGPGGVFEMVEDDVLGARLPVFVRRPRSLAATVDAAAGHGDRPFAVEGDRTVTFADLPDRVRDVAARLAAAGVGRGDRVAMAGRPSLDHCLVALGTMARGAIATVLNPAWTDDEVAHALATTAPTLHLGEDGPRSFADLLAGPAPTPLAPDEVAVAEDDAATIIFTSGTTGRPKGAVLSHRNAIHFCWSAAATNLVHRLAVPGGSAPGGGNPPAVVASAPLFHMSGLLGQLVNAVTWGITLVVPPPGRWDATTHLELTERHRVTTWSLVPTQLWRIVDHPDLDRFDLSSLEAIGGGGAAFPPELLRRAAERLPGAGTGVRVGYGMTEASGTLTLVLPPVGDADLASVGGATAGSEVEVRDPSGRPLPEGEIGQIWGRSAGVFRGYWGNEAATRAVFDEDRWYATGDYGRIELEGTDGGRLFVESRLRDMIIRGGENIYPIEIENRLVEHPAIVDAAVVGVPDRVLGEQVKALVVVAPGAEVGDDEVRDWVGATLARYKVPALVERRDALPRNALGKLDKEQLRGEAGVVPRGTGQAPTGAAISG
jgi:acyl-CoA synthetase (AMP-forming)/AMP-acid ligase II